MLDYAHMLTQLHALSDAPYALIIEDDLVPAHHFDALTIQALEEFSDSDPWSYITLYSERFYAEPQPIYRLIKHKKGYCHCGGVALLFRSVARCRGCHGLGSSHHSYQAG